MNRSRTALAVTVVALALLAGCGSRDASQSSVQDKVEELLVENGYGEQDLSAPAASAAATCVAQTMFESGEFEKDERNDIASSSDGDPIREDLVVRLEALIEGCVDDASDEGPTSSSSENDDEDEDSTTTTEG